MNRTMAKILFTLVPIFVIALLAVIMADPYYQQPFYTWYFLISVTVILILWIATSLILKVAYTYPLPKGIYFRMTAAWTVTAFLAWVINHLVLSSFLISQGAKPGWSIFGLMFMWIVGLLAILVEQFGLSLLQRIFLTDQSRALRIMILVLFGMIVAMIAAIMVINTAIRHKFRSMIYTYQDVPAGGIAIVFGAGVYSETERPSLVLRERLETTAMLVKEGKVDQVLLSGDGSPESIEVDVMARYSFKLGIPDEMLMLDREGFRTLDTCKRAYEEFGVRDAVLVTQNFHLPRALFLCESMDLEARGVQADQRIYSPFSRLTWTMRESVATANAWLEVITGRRLTRF
jgi:SanA protein